MAIYLYEYEDSENTIEFTQTKLLEAIPRLVLKNFIEEEFKKRNQEPLKWHMKEDDLINVANSSGLISTDKHTRSSRYAIVIDLKPGVPNNVSLYWIRDIWGYSTKEWTPLCLRASVLFADLRADDPNELKRKFAISKNDKGLENVFEFLYIQAGVKRGTWKWGPVGTVNGALLWPDPMKFFIENINRYI